MHSIRKSPTQDRYGWIPGKLILKVARNSWILFRIPRVPPSCEIRSWLGGSGHEYKRLQGWDWSQIWVNIDTVLVSPLLSVCCSVRWHQNTYLPSMLSSSCWLWECQSTRTQIICECRQTQHRIHLVLVESFISLPFLPPSYHLYKSSLNQPLTARSKQKHHFFNLEHNYQPCLAPSVIEFIKIDVNSSWSASGYHALWLISER